MKIGLYLFDNDCRLSDNIALRQLREKADHLVCVYFPSPSIWTARKSQTEKSTCVKAFQQNTLYALQTELNQYQQTLFTLPDPLALSHLIQLIKDLNISHVARSVHPGYDEQKVWQALQHELLDVEFISAYSATLFNLTELPISLSELPPSFTPFRKKVDQLEVREAQAKPASLPPLPHSANTLSYLAPVAVKSLPACRFDAGSHAAKAYLADYFSDATAQHYKQTRNALMGQRFSTQFSPYLASGAISPVEVVAALQQHEQQFGSNESTYWIWFELLWREYFHWYSLKHGERLFAFSGVKGKTPKTSFYPERYHKWCEGKTPSPLINAIMNELNATGWISNRARQITASYFVNELQLDWRYGAAYFEQRLIDYDVAANWGNWQYIAGVGADPRGGRHFNITKQQQQFDPNGDYIKAWQGKSYPDLDSRDYVDWPKE